MLPQTPAAPTVGARPEGKSMRGNQPFLPGLPACRGADDLPCIDVAGDGAPAAVDSGQDIALQRPDPGLQAAVAAAVALGMSIKDVAAAAHMTALEVLDAADSLTYSDVAVPPAAASGPLKP